MVMDNGMHGLFVSRILSTVFYMQRIAKCGPAVLLLVVVVVMPGEGDAVAGLGAGAAPGQHHLGRHHLHTAPAHTWPPPTAVTVHLGGQGVRLAPGGGAGGGAGGEGVHAAAGGGAVQEGALQQVHRGLVPALLLARQHGHTV